MKRIYIALAFAVIGIGLAATGKINFWTISGSLLCIIIAIFLAVSIPGAGYSGKEKEDRKHINDYSQGDYYHNDHDNDNDSDSSI